MLGFSQIDLVSGFTVCSDFFSWFFRSPDEFRSLAQFVRFQMIFGYLITQLFLSSQMISVVLTWFCIFENCVFSYSFSQMSFGFLGFGSQMISKWFWVHFTFFTSSSVCLFLDFHSIDYLVIFRWIILSEFSAGTLCENKIWRGPFWILCVVRRTVVGLSWLHSAQKVIVQWFEVVELPWSTQWSKTIVSVIWKSLSYPGSFSVDSVISSSEFSQCKYSVVVLYLTLVELYWSTQCREISGSLRPQQFVGSPHSHKYYTFVELYWSTQCREIPGSLRPQQFVGSPHSHKYYTFVELYWSTQCREISGSLRPAVCWVATLRVYEDFSGFFFFLLESSGKCKSVKTSESVFWCWQWWGRYRVERWYEPPVLGVPRIHERKNEERVAQRYDIVNKEDWISNPLTRSDGSEPLDPSNRIGLILAIIIIIAASGWFECSLL